MTDKQIDINNQVEVGLNIAKELLELHKMFEDEVEKSPHFIQTNFIKNKLFYFYQRADWLNVCFNLLDKQLKAKEQECEELKDLVNHNGRVCNERLDKIDELEHNINELNEQLDQLKAENDSLKRQLQFEFDETLLQYSNTIEDLQKQLNNTVMQKCPQCGEVYLNPVGCELHEENQQIKAENKTQKETIDGFLTILDKLGKSNIKLRETLTEIKEIAEKQIPYLDIDKAKTMIEVEQDYVGKIYNLEQRMYTIIQKISEVV